MADYIGTGMTSLKHTPKGDTDMTEHFEERTYDSYGESLDYIIASASCEMCAARDDYEYDYR